MKSISWHTMIAMYYSRQAYPLSIGGV